MLQLVVTHEISEISCQPKFLTAVLPFLKDFPSVTTNFTMLFVAERRILLNRRELSKQRANNNSATHILVNQFGCDSTINLDLTVGGNSIGDTLSISSCDNYLWNGKYYDSTGTFNDTLTAQNGCDSISTLSFTKLTSSYGDTTALNNCDSLNWNGTYFYTSGNFEDTLVNNNGCDSIVFLAATIFTSHSTNENISY